MTASASRSMSNQEVREVLLAFSERCRSCRHKGSNVAQDKCVHPQAYAAVVSRGLCVFDLGYAAGWTAANRRPYDLPWVLLVATARTPCPLYERAHP